MWIELKKGQYPTKNGTYKCLVEVDETGELVEMYDQVFRNGDWCHYKSCRQFIRFWWSEEKAKQKEILKDIMQLDEELGMYE
jgi:hypothetical protein